MAELDLTDLQEEVIEHWDNEGVQYEQKTQAVEDRPELLPFANTVLSNLYEMLAVLGFDSISQYIAEKQQEAL